MTSQTNIHLKYDDEIILEHVAAATLNPYARLKFGGVSGHCVFASPEQIATLHRLTGEYLEARKAESDNAAMDESVAALHRGEVFDLEAIQTLDNDGGKAAEVANG